MACNRDIFTYFTIYYCHVYERHYRRFGLMIRFIGHFDTARYYTLQFITTHTHPLVPIHVFNSRCSVAVSNGEVPLSLGS
jgi:hypothetical protein